MRRLSILRIDCGQLHEVAVYLSLIVVVTSASFAEPW